MHIILADGTQLNHIGATGETRYLQGANRDTITFILDETHSIDELDALFNEANCELINIVTDEVVELEDGTTQVVYSDNYHRGYVIKGEISKKIVVIEPATVDTAEVTETRIHVTMAQRTYAETKLMSMYQEITDTQLALCELYEGGLV